MNPHRPPQGVGGHGPPHETAASGPPLSDPVAYDLIREFILKRASRGERVRVEIGPATLLVESELIDSFGLLDLIAYLEETFHIRISRKEATVDNFRTIDKILALVQSKKV